MTGYLSTKLGENVFGFSNQCGVVINLAQGEYSWTTEKDGTGGFSMKSNSEREAMTIITCLDHDQCAWATSTGTGASATVAPVRSMAFESCKSRKSASQGKGE